MPLPAKHNLIDPHQLQVWLDELPWLDTRRTAACILESLLQLAKAGLPWQQRHELLQAYHPHLHQLTDALEQSLLDAPLPLSDGPVDNARLLLQLCCAMVENHTQLVFDHSLEENKDAPLAETVSRTLDWLARQALYQAQIYTPPGDTFWQTFYRIYHLIEKHDLLGPGLEPQSELRIHLFRILLFHLASPQRFRQRELQQIDRFLIHFAHWAVIKRQPRYRTHKAGFFFDCNTPRPPCSIKLLKQIEPPPGEVRFLFLQAVTQKLLNYVGSAQPEGFETLPFVQTRKLALRLAHLYGAPRQRRWRRLEGKGRRRLVVGLEDLIAVLDQQGHVHHGLRGLLPRVPKKEDANVLFAADFELLPQEDRSDPDLSRRRSEIGCFQYLQQSKSITSREEIWPSAASAPQPMHFPGHLADASARGYRLIWLDHSVAKLKVGEILSLFQEQNDHDLEIAAIRWLRSNPDGSVTVGVELLSFTTQVVVVSQKIPHDCDLEPQRDWGLLLPEQPAIQHPTCLLAPAFTWQKGQWVDIYRSKEDKTGYSLPRLLESSPAYDLFTLEKLS